MGKHKRRLTADEVQQALKMRQAGYSDSRLADYFNVNRPSIWKSLKGKAAGTAPVAPAVIPDTKPVNIEPFTFGVGDLKEVRREG